MNRRNVLRLSILPALIAISGCTEYVHKARGVDTPINLIVENVTGEPLAIALQIERNGDSVFQGTVEFDEDGGVESVEGDDFRNAEFSEVGIYTVTAETNERREQSNADISWRYLADCNDNIIEVLVRESDIQARLLRTDMACSFPDNLGRE